MRAIEFIDNELEESRLGNLGLATFIGAAGTAGLEVPKYFKDKDINPPAITAPYTKPITPPVTSLPATKEITPAPERPIAPAPKEVAPPSPKEILQLVRKVAIDNGLNGKELAQFLGQCAHESYDFRNLEEVPDKTGRAYFNRYDIKFNPQMAKKLGNTNPGDGYNYRGRGFIHLTGKYNYQKAGEALGINLVEYPELAADPEIAADIALWYWKKKVAPNVKGDFSNTKQVTGQINPGLAGMRSREEYYKKYKSM